MGDRLIRKYRNINYQNIGQCCLFWMSSLSKDHDWFLSDSKELQKTKKHEIREKINIFSGKYCKRQYETKPVSTLLKITILKKVIIIAKFSLPKKKDTKINNAVNLVFDINKKKKSKKLKI